MRNSVQLLRLTKTCLVVHGVTIATMVYLAKKCQETIQGSLFNNYFLQQEETDNNEVVEVEDHLVEPDNVVVDLVVDVDADNNFADPKEDQMVVVVEVANQMEDKLVGQMEDKIEDKMVAIVVPKGRRIRIILGMMIMAVLWKITLIRILSPSILMTYLVSNCIKKWKKELKNILGITDASNCDCLQDVIAEEDPKEDSKEQQMEQLEQQMEQQMEQ